MNNFIAHILVVDDDDGIRSLVKQYLNENKFLVTTSNSAENANEKIEIIKFDLIVLDVMMSGKSGLDFIKENKETIDIKTFSDCHIWWIIILLKPSLNKKWGNNICKVGSADVAVDHWLK